MNSEEFDIKLPDRLKESPFSVPNGYFDSLPGCIMQKCTNQAAEKQTFWKAVKPALSFAAGFLLLFGISKIIINTVNIDSRQNSHYTSQSNSDEVQQIVPDEEMDDDMEDEIISYLIDENYVSRTFVEDEYTP